MGLSIRRIRVEAATPRGLYGFDIPFNLGLNIVRAENTCGKSTCALSILYALGLEGMLQASHAVPMADVVTDRLLDGQTEVTVLESSVCLEIENNLGARATVKRNIKHETIDHRMISVWDGFALSAPDSAKKVHDLFVRVAGAAKRELGFHTWLNTFIGWSMPVVPRTDGQEGALYLEHLAPLHYIEQKKGWGGIQAGTPSFGVREPTKRALEFTLDLSGPKNSWQRERLREAITRTREDWKSLLAIADASASRASGRVVGISETPTAQWPPAPLPYVDILEGGKRLHLQSVVEAVRHQIEELRRQTSPAIKDVSKELEGQLHSAHERAIQLGGVRNAMGDQIGQDSAYFESASKRLQALEEELQRNKDAKKLQEMGSKLYGLPDTESCQACGQPLPESLLPVGSGVPVMTIDDNIDYIASQVQTLSIFKEKLENSLLLQRDTLSAVESELGAVSTQIRDIKESLLEDGRLPSREAIRTQILLEEKARVQQDCLEDFGRRLDQFRILSEKYRELQAQLKDTPVEDVPEDDRTKLNRLKSVLIDQLRDYGFNSIPLNSIEISGETYRPVRDGVEVGYSLSASDMIRLVWAYLVGILELSHEFSTRHAGLLIFDEPRQQSAKEMSFKKLIERASHAGERRQQIIIFTSEPRVALKDMVANLDVNVIEIEGRMVNPL